MRCLREYIRIPGAARTPAEGVNMIRSWKRARTRAIQLGMPDVGDLEMRDGLIGIVQNLREQNENMDFRIKAALATNEARQPSVRFMDLMEKALIEELKAMQADANSRFWSESEQPQGPQFNHTHVTLPLKNHHRKQDHQQRHSLQAPR